MEILGVAKFGNLQISQVANFRNLRNFAGCQFSQPLTCLLTAFLSGGLIQVFPYIILILQYTFVISSLLSLYKLIHACNQGHLVIQSISQA